MHAGAVFLIPQLGFFTPPHAPTFAAPSCVLTVYVVHAGGVFLVPQLCIAHPLTRQAFIMSKLVHQVLHYVSQRLLASELQPKLVKAPYM